MVRRASPVRTCVGCRKWASAKELLRIVAEMHEGGVVALVPDSARRKPGRGVHLHPDPACLALAERRHVFGRALRVTGVLDTGQLAGAIAGANAPGGPSGPCGSQSPTVGHDRLTRPSKVGRPT